MRKNIVFLIVLIACVSVFSMTVQPFGLFGNAALVREDFTALLKIVPFAEIEFGQNILTLNNINALLNEEDFIINEQTLSAALQEGFKFGLPVSFGGYVHLNLGGFRIVPYTRIDGNIFLNIPKTIPQLLVGDTNIDETYSDSLEGFLVADVMANGGIAIVLGSIYVAGNLFAPVLYTDYDLTRLDVSYTSSATPAYAEFNADAHIRAYSRVSLNDLINQNIDSIIEQLSNVDDYGMSLEFGFGTPNFGIAVRNIAIRPAKAYYSVDFNANANFTYTAEGTDVTAEATYSTSEPIVAQLFAPIEVAPAIQITGYLKNDGFIMWGIMGSYWLDGKWAAKGYAGLNLAIARVYYMLGFNQVAYAHTIGINANLFFLNADLKLTATSNSLMPSENTTPGIGFSLMISAGL
ncbi:MAG: hypothetical protein ACUVQF_06655 [Fervidobacterium sp.]|uniref:hypothetical protein n=1 Tax=Fervidobacterium sp. TaxID=1871331 RepID=UPI00404900E5